MSEQRVAVDVGPHRPMADRRAVHFLRHLGEMTLAMMIGMFALYGLVEGALTVVFAGALGEVESSALAMAFSMSVSMAGWMRYRRHGWPPILEMSGAMIVPAVALLVALRAGALSAETVPVVQHAIMLPSMIAAMLHRRSEYVELGPRHPRAALRSRRDRSGRARDQAQDATGKLIVKAGPTGTGHHDSRGGGASVDHVRCGPWKAVLV